MDLHARSCDIFFNPKVHVLRVVFRALRDFAEDVETQIQGLNAEIDTQTLAGGAKINRLFYNEFADALSLVSRN